jgi:heme oxygenase
MSLKELTHEAHKNAETQPFVKILFSGKINPKLYATFLYNQHKMYDLLEALAMMHGLMNDYPTIRRAPSIFSDYSELWEDKENPPQELPVVKRYHDHLMSIKDDPKKLLAHLYVKHFGDLSGGQMIKKRVPGSGRYYEFDGNPEEIKNILRQKLDDSLAEEAILSFSYAADTFKDMMELVEFVDE